MEEITTGETTTEKRGTIVKGAASQTETIIVVCQCGGTGFTVSKRSKTAVILKCAKCGCTTSVKGAVALTHTDNDEVTAAVVKSVIRPYVDGDSEDAPKEKNSNPKNDQYTMLRFRVGIEAKNNVIDKAMEAVRLQNYSSDEFRAQTWQGHALEYLCADFLSGCDPIVIAHLEDMEEQIRQVVAEKSEEKRSVVKRVERETRNKLLEQAAEEIGHKPKKKIKPAKKEKKEIPMPIDDRILDNGRLLTSVKNALFDAAEQYTAETQDQFQMLVGITLSDAMKRAESSGGFVIRVVGDERAPVSTGNQAIVYFWIEFEPAGVDIDIRTPYNDAMNELTEPKIVITEIIPNDLPDGEDGWEVPIMCDGRERVKG